MTTHPSQRHGRVTPQQNNETQMPPMKSQGARTLPRLPFIRLPFLGAIVVSAAVWSGPQAIGAVAVASGNWSNPATWGGALPGVEEAVTIPAGFAVVLDANVECGGIIVGGRLEVQRADRSLLCDWLIVQGADAVFEVGTNASRFMQNFTLTLKGLPSEVAMESMGAKVLGAHNGGTLQIHGRNRVEWTHLGANAAVGATSMTLAEQVDWVVGDSILVTSSRSNPDEAETRTITAVSPDLRTVSFATALVHLHNGSTITRTRSRDQKSWTGDLRAEVGLLSRNVRIQGDAASETAGFGGHIMVMNGGPTCCVTSGKAYIQGVELFRMGQKSIVGRYPMHWHMVAEAGVGQYFRDNVVRRSFNRAITIHGTESTLVENNFCYDHLGHGLFLEDGSERFNIIRRNVVLGTKKPLPGEEILQTDNAFATPQNKSPASYWITNPNNTFTDNVAAGTVGTGYWLAFPRKPLNASLTHPRFSSMEPFKQPLGAFSGNTAHSCGSGLDINDQVNADDTLALNGEWANNGPFYFDNCTWYSNVIAIYAGIGGGRKNVVYRDNVFSDNGTNLFLATYQLCEESLMIVDSGFGIMPTSSPRVVYAVYDGAGRMKNNHLVGFNGANGRFLQNIGAAVKHPNHYFEGLTFDPPGPPRSILVNYQIISPPNVGANDPGHPRIWAQVIVDVDGSIAGVPNSSIVSNHPFLLTGSETRPSIWTNMYRSDHRFAQCLLNYGLPSDSNPNISVLRTKPGTRTAGVYYINGFKEHHQLPLIVRDDFLYTYYYESLPSTRTINLSVNDAEVGDHYLVCFKDFGKLPGITASGMTSRTSLAALKASTTSAFFRETNGDFYVRPVATSPFQGHAIRWDSNITLPVVDSDGDGVSDGAEAAAGTDPFRAVDGTEPFVNSEFNVPGHFGHWSGFSGIANETVNSGVLAGQTTNTNSQMVENNLRIAGSEVPFLLVRMRASQNGNAQIFWGRLDAPSYVSARSVTVNYSGNNEWRVLTFPMQSNAEWQGQIITNLRFDPTTLSGVDFEVDWIRASTVGPGIKAATGSTLNLDSAWTSAFVPVNPDIATWNAGSRAGAMTLGGPLHWAGLTVNDVTGPISFHGTPTLTLGSGGIEMSAATADLTLHHPVVLSANQTWRVNDGRTLTVNGQISGSVGFTKSGLGALTLAGPNTFSGNVTIFSGPATITNSSALGTGAKSIAITNGTTGDCALHLDGSAEAITLPAEVSLQTSRANGNGALVNDAGHNRIAGPISMVGGGGNTLITVLGGSLALDGAIASNFTSGRTLQLASASTATNEVNGIIQNGSSATSLAIQSGTWLLTNANTHTGATTVSGGTLALSGSLASALTVNGGLFAPRGTPSVTGAVAVNATSVFQVRLTGPTVGSQHDQLTASGNVTLAGGLDLIPGPGLTGGSTFRILNKASAGSISGSFAGRPAGSTFVEDGYTWTISYTGGDGNDVTVTLATASQAWRFAHFGTTANSGNAADQFDANGDGESNLLEFATAQNPHAATKATAQLLRNGSMLEYTYPRSVAAMASGVTFAVEWHDTLAPSGWSNVGVTELVLSDNGTVQQVRARLPRGTTGSRFVRLRIVQP